ncbi:transporter substrate-binding domain-containing protein [Spirobacillus cienkowskii]|uniref:substrate-binding periplasmic protein n=1 Tax=Spirobacillus cienkowskii TaxID=495820 RepID=UPI0030CC6A2B
MLRLRCIRTICILASFLSNLFCIAEASEYHISLGINPPYTIKLDNKNPEGIFLEIIHEALNNSNIKLTIDNKEIPWKRAHENKEENNLLFYLSRTPAREKNYTWIVSLFRDEPVLTNLNDSIVIKKTEDLKQIKKIGAIAGGGGESFLKSNGLVKNFYSCKDETQCYNLLLENKIEAVISPQVKAKFVVKKLKIDHLVKSSKGLSAVEGWLASTLNMSQKNQVELKNAIQKFKKTSRYENILKKYQANRP